MKAVQIDRFGGPDVMEIVDVPMPEPGEGQVRIKVEAAGLNYADIMIRQGTYIDEIPLPYRLGREFCGVIDKVGPGTNGLVKGQRVVGSVHGGAMAEYVVTQPLGLVPCPDGLSPEQGAGMLIQGITAMHCIDDVGRVQPGETVLVHAAAGGVGTLAVQIANARGASVIGTASSEQKCKLIIKLGAAAINYTRGDWVKEVCLLTGGRGADVILESVGGEVFRRSFTEALAVFGRMVVYGISSTRLEKLHNRQILESNRSVTGYYLGAYFPKHLDRVVAATTKLVDMIRAGRIEIIVGSTFPLDHVVEAFNHMQSRKSIGKVVIKP